MIFGARKASKEGPGPYTRAMISATRELGLTDIEYMDVGSVAVMGKVIRAMARRIVDLEAKVEKLEAGK